jgi:uncharacterized delta-60 repeat protein
MCIRQLSTIIFFVIIIHTNTSAQNNRNAIDSSRFNGPVNVIIVQRDGKMIIGGNFFTYNKQERRGIIRLNADGSIDNSFAVRSGFGGEVNALVLQPDGKLIAGGAFSKYDGASCNKIARLNSDGSLDNSFATGIGFRGNVMALALQADGKIIVGGMLGNFNGVACGGLVRLNANGSLDQNFVYVKGISGYVYCISLLGNGKIMAGGYFGHFDKTVAYGIVRLNSDGSLDNSFVTKKGFGTGSVYAILPLSNGKIILAGNFKTYDDSTCHFIARLNGDGSLDKSFPVSGLPTKEYSGYGIFSLAMQPDGKILVAGKFDYYNTTLRQCVLRLNSDGSLDNSFGAETGFDTQGHGAALVSTIALTSNGNILAGGYYKRYDSALRNNITELDKNGKLLKIFIP